MSNCSYRPMLILDILYKYYNVGDIIDFWILDFEKKNGIFNSVKTDANLFELTKVEDPRFMK